MLSYWTKIVSLMVLLGLVACTRFDNTLNLLKLDCGSDVAPFASLVKVHLQNGEPLLREEIEAMKLSKDSDRWESIEVSSRGCLQLPQTASLLIRSKKGNESIFLSEEQISSTESKIQLQDHSVEHFVDKCPVLPLKREDLDLGQFFGQDGEVPEIVSINYRLELLGDTPRQINEGSSYFLGRANRTSLPGELSDGRYRLTFQSTDLRRGQVKSSFCEITLDQLMPEVTLSEQTIRAVDWKGRKLLVVPRDEQLRFLPLNFDPNGSDTLITYCFRPLESPLQQDPRLDEICSPREIRFARLQDPISPPQNSGIWQLSYQAADRAGNVTSWVHLRPLIFADQQKIEQIKTESRQDLMAAVVMKDGSEEKLAQKALSNYHLWQSFKTDYERDISREDVLSSLMASYINLLNKPALFTMGFKGNVMTLSNDGTEIYFGTDRGDIEHYSIAEGKLIRVLKGHSKSFASLNLNDARNLLLTASFDQTIRLWDLKSGTAITQIGCCEGEYLRSAITSDGELFVTSSWLGKLKIWKKDGTLLRTIDQSANDSYHRDVIMGVAITPDDQKILTASWDGSIKVWDIQSGELLTTFATKHEGGANVVVVSGDGNLAVSAGREGKILVHNLKNGTLNRVIAQISVQITALALKNNILVSGSLDNKIRRFDLSTGQQLDFQAIAERFITGTVALDITGQITAAIANSDMVKIWGSTAQSPHLKVLRSGKQSSLRTLNIGEGSHHLYAAGVGSEVTVWDVENFKPAFHSEPKDDTVYKLKNCEDASDEKVHALTRSGLINSFSPNFEVESTPLSGLEGDWPYSLDYGPHCDMFVGTWNGKVLHLRDGVKIAENSRVSLAGWAKVLYEKKNKRLWVLGRDQALHILNPETLQEESRIQFDEALTAALISKDEKRLYLSLWNGKIASVLLDELRIESQIKSDSGIIWDLHRDEETGWIVSAGQDGTVRFWSPETLSPIGLPLQIGNSAVRTMTSTRDWKLITGDDNGLLKLWKLTLSKDPENLKQALCRKLAPLLESYASRSQPQPILSEVCNKS